MSELGISQEPDMAAAKELYFPLPAALEAGRLDIESLDPNNPQDAGIMLRNGRVPKKAGIIEVSKNTLGAYDVVDGEFTDDSLTIYPTSKGAVGKHSRMIQGGNLIVLTSPAEGTITPVAEIASASRSEWNSAFTRFGLYAVRSLVWTKKQYEIDSICCDSGKITSFLPKRYF